MGKSTNSKWFEIKLKLIDLRWVIIPVFLAIFYLVIIINFYITLLSSTICWAQDMTPFIEMMPYHIALFIFAMMAYLIGWFMKNRIISSLYFLIMIAGFITLPIYYPYQFIIGGVILVGIVKIKKPAIDNSSEIIAKG
jgi:hypothetical protein